MKVILIKPGSTDTPMTLHRKQSRAKLASVEHVAKSIVVGIASGKQVIYTPVIWAVIMFVIKHLPNFIFKRIDA